MPHTGYDAPRLSWSGRPDLPEIVRQAGDGTANGRGETGVPNLSSWILALRKYDTAEASYGIRGPVPAHATPPRLIPASVWIDPDAASRGSSAPGRWPAAKDAGSGILPQVQLPAAAWQVYPWSIPGTIRGMGLSLFPGPMCDEDERRYWLAGSLRLPSLSGRAETG